MLRWVTDSLRQFHTSGLTLPAEMNPFRMTEYYYQTACEYGIRAREEEVFGWAHSVAERIEEAVAFEITSPCHTDLTAVNILDDGGGGIRLLDWEYSSMSDPRFDLADLSANQGFTADDDRRLVLFYYGAVNERSVAEIRLLRFMSLFKNLTWSYVQSRIAGTDREADNGTSGRGYDQEKGGLSCAQRAREELAADGDELRGLSHSEDGSEGGGLDLRAVGIADFDFDSFAEGYLRRMQTITEDPEFERWLSIMVSGAS
jgi:thiamine kinase-like enzyme